MRAFEYVNYERFIFCEGDALAKSGNDATWPGRPHLRNRAHVRFAPMYPVMSRGIASAWKAVPPKDNTLTGSAFQAPYSFSISPGTSTRFARVCTRLPRYCLPGKFSNGTCCGQATRAARAAGHSITNEY